MKKDYYVNRVDRNADRHTGWSTEAEKQHIDGLGEWSILNNGRMPTMTKREHLEKYLNNCYNRVIWGNMNRETVIEYVKKKLGNMINTADTADTIGEVHKEA